MNSNNNVNIQDSNLKAVGQFFYGYNFNEPAFVTSRGRLGFNILKDDIESFELMSEIKSVRWVTSFSPKKSGYYMFKAGGSDFIHIFINGESIIEKSIYLEKEKSYKLIVAYFGNLNVVQDELINLNVINLYNGKEVQVDLDEFHLPKSITFEELGDFLNADSNNQELIDTDDDGIYDDWEINGYTVIGHVVHPWKEDYAKRGFKKYTSNPYESHTAGDPYSDLEKASGGIDKSINKVARDPLIAAYPSVSVRMEKLIISNNKQVNFTEGKTVGRSTSSSIGSSNTAGVDASVSFSLFSGVSASITGHYSHTSTQTVDSSQTSGQDWHTQLNLSEGQSAYINTNIRYINTGTAPIYNLKPTANIVLGKETIATISSQINQEAFSLGPGKIFPKKNTHGIALNTLDQFSSTPISINLEQLERLELGEKLKLETTQFEGKFARRSPIGGQVIIDENEWSHYLPQIESVTAGITINLYNNGIIERRIAARDLDDPNDLTPELTLGEALKRAVGAVYSNNDGWYFIDEITLKKHMLDPSLVHFIYDRFTHRLIEKEKNSGKNNFYDIVIRPGMNIQINVPVRYDKFKDDQMGWNGGVYDQTNGIGGGRCYKFSGEAELDGLDLEGSTKYLILMDVKATDNCKLEVIANDNNAKIRDIGRTYKREHIVFEVFENEKTLDTLTLKTSGTVYIDNFSIIKLDKAIDNLKKENSNYNNENITSKKHSFIPVKDITKCITNENGSVTITSSSTNSKSEFYIGEDNIGGGFRIYEYSINSSIDSNSNSLTWNPITQELRFSHYKNSKYQIWFFKKEIKDGVVAYKIISSADRSKVLEYTPDDRVDNIKINDIREEEDNQRFIWRSTNK